MSWAKRAPKTMKQRRALLARCGPRAFLDPANLKYPVMAKSGACRIDCAGAKAAYSRARQWRRKASARKVVGRANALRSRCER